MNVVETTNFIKYYVKSMRPYYSFITGIAGWIGVSFARFLYPEDSSVVKAFMVLLILFLSWGINQIVNDYLGLEEDRINAPNRPMVTGDLNVSKALVLSSILLLFAFIFTWFLSPVAVVPLLIGVILNIVYEKAKGVPVLGNIIFGIMISMCTAYGYLCIAPPEISLFTSSRLSVLFLVVLLNGLMTYYTYFKDYAGDKMAGKITAIVYHGIEKSRYIAVLSSFLPSIAFVALKLLGYIDAPLNDVFIFLFIVTLFLQIWTGILYFKYPEGKKAYDSLVINFRACTCGQVTLIALFNKELALYLYIFAYVFIGFLFGLHEDHKA